MGKCLELVESVDLLGLTTPEAILLAIVGALTAFPLWMMIHCIIAPKDLFLDSAPRRFWFVLIFVTGVLGAAVYFFVIYRNRDKSMNDRHQVDIKDG